MTQATPTVAEFTRTATEAATIAGVTLAPIDHSAGGLLARITGAPELTGEQARQFLALLDVIGVRAGDEWVSGWIGDMRVHVAHQAEGVSA